MAGQPLPDLSGMKIKCNQTVRLEDVFNDAAEVPISRITQFLSDRARCLHLCAVFPRRPMSKYYPEKRVALPPAPSELKQNVTGERRLAMVIYVENMLSPNAEYVNNIKFIYRKCIKSDVDLFIYTDAFIDKEVDERCIYTQRTPLKVGGALVHENIDKLLDVSKSTHVEAQLKNGYRVLNWDRKYGRIDAFKMYATLDILRRGYDVVAYQDIGKVSSIVHFLNDPMTIALVEKTGLIQGGGSFPENYAWITHKSALKSWEYTLSALVQFLENPPPVKVGDTSYYSTLSTVLIRQHYVYTRADHIPFSLESLDMRRQIVNAAEPGKDGGSLLPCQYTFVNSKYDLNLAIKLNNLQCHEFNNVASNTLDEGTMQKVVTNLGLLMLINSQLALQNDNTDINKSAFIICADDQLHKLLFSHKKRQ